MTSAVDICNMALAFCRGGRIESLTENTVAATQCGLFYEVCRDQCLEAADWGFATKQAPLALLDSDLFSVTGWAYVYQYPSDCLKVQRVSLEVTMNSIAQRHLNQISLPDFDPLVPYEIMDIDGTTVIVSNDENLQIRYTVKVEEVNKFSSAFKFALSHLLCSNIAVSLTGEATGSNFVKSSLAIYQRYIDSAIANDLNQRRKQPSYSEFITCRY